MRGFVLSVALLAASTAWSAPAAALGPYEPTMPVYEQQLTPDAVRMIQERMRELGIYRGPTDGIWGPNTQGALYRYQQSHGLQAIGQMNQATALAMGLDPSQLVTIGSATAQGPNVAQYPAYGRPLSYGDIRAIQYRMRQLGFYHGPIDGVWGPGTAAALDTFQENRGIQPGGRVDSTTLAALGFDPNNPAASSGSSIPSGIR